MNEETQREPTSEPEPERITTSYEKIIVHDQGRMSPRQRQLLIIASVVAVLVTIVVVILIWRSRNSAAPEAATVVAVSVKVVKAEKEPIAAQISAVGTIFPRDKADVAAKVSAQIKRMALLKNKLGVAGGYKKAADAT